MQRQRQECSNEMIEQLIERFNGKVIRAQRRNSHPFLHAAFAFPAGQKCHQPLLLHLILSLHIVFSVLVTYQASKTSHTQGNRAEYKQPILLPELESKSKAL